MIIVKITITLCLVTPPVRAFYSPLSVVRQPFCFPCWTCRYSSLVNRSLHFTKTNHSSPLQRLSHLCFPFVNYLVIPVYYRLPSTLLNPSLNPPIHTLPVSLFLLPRPTTHTPSSCIIPPYSSPLTMLHHPPLKPRLTPTRHPLHPSHAHPLFSIRHQSCSNSCSRQVNLESVI